MATKTKVRDELLEYLSGQLLETRHALDMARRACGMHSEEYGAARAEYVKYSALVVAYRARKYKEVLPHIVELHERVKEECVGIEAALAVFDELDERNKEVANDWITDEERTNQELLIAVSLGYGTLDSLLHTGIRRLKERIRHQNRKAK